MRPPGAIALLYLVDLGMMLFGHPILHEGGPMGIIFSVVVVGIAAMNRVLDFDFIESGVQQGAPQYMEWCGAFGLMVTLIWLYLEILRLLGKARKRVPGDSRARLHRAGCGSLRYTGPHQRRPH